MSGEIFGNPLSVARIFLSHSWSDNELTDHLASALDKRFTVDYDRATELRFRSPSPIPAGGPLVPKAEILRCDLFLFAASGHSFRSDSRAREELQFVESIHPANRPPVILIALEDFRVPESEVRGRYLRLRRDTRVEDARTIVRELETKLMTAGGLYRGVKLPGERVRAILGGARSEIVLDALTSEYKRGLYSLNVVLPAKEMNDTLNCLRMELVNSGEVIRNRLLELYLHEHTRSECTVARQNAIIVLSRLFPGERDLIREVTRRRPDFPTRFLYRGFHIALGLLGDDESVLRYTRRLEERRGSEWTSQNELNKGFHLRYYGGEDPTLTVLRDSCRSLDPGYLLPLNVYTLSLLSRFKEDVVLLSEQMDKLVLMGVPRSMIHRAIRRIRGA
ncbi:MAG: toll/interleukin-1 receptor domain-containing protein [Longimicrobiaceae bacterium]